MNRDQGMSLEHPSPPSLDEDLRGFGKELRESWESLTARRAAGLVQTDKEELALDLDLAKRLCTSLAGRPQQLWALAKESEVDLSAWLIETMMDLSHNGHLDDALTLRSDLGMLLTSIDRVVYRPLLLALAGQHKEAITEAKTDLARTPDDLTIADHVATVLFTCSQLSDAERLSRHILTRSLRGSHPHQGAVQRLVEILHQTGRHKEARQLLTQHGSPSVQSGSPRS
ncbi:MAG: hypothetical protein JNM83_02875 [Myxococcales bacterium]|nr:hypothetical protein [Myxococcales bacterium]